MGNSCCWGSHPSPSNTTTHHNKVGTSNTSSTMASTSSGSTAISGSSSGFSAASGDTAEALPQTSHILPLPALRIFTLSELKIATKNFRPDALLGEGGFGRVYKGKIEEKPPSRNSGGRGSLVAVKKLNSESMQGHKEWQAEVNFLGQLSHPNLVKLLGYCSEDDELLLIYEFMQKGSLENHLFGRGAMVQPLPWGIRLKIVIGAARGLAYLHNSEKQVIYRDFKASNILLDASFNAKISDFGLAKVGPSESKSHVTTKVMGTYGYAAPEYVATGHLYVKSDVFGFGVVLVEILTGLRAIDKGRPSGKETLVDWINPYLSSKRKLKSIMDSNLNGKYPSAAAYQVAQLAFKCLAQEPRCRPSMEEVVQALEKVEVSSSEKSTEPRSHSARPRQVQLSVPQPHRSPLHSRQNAGAAYQVSPKVR